MSKKMLAGVVLTAGVLLFPAGTLIAAFEFKGSGARSASLAGAYTAVSDDAESLWWNPAGLRLVENIQLDASHTQLYGLSELSRFNLTAAVPTLGMGSWGFGFSSFGSSAYRETDLRVGFAAGLGSGVYFGTNLKSNLVSIDSGEETAGSFGLDLGLMGNITPEYSIGVSAYNLNRPQITSNPVEYLQQRLMIGLYATPIEGIALSVDMHKVEDTHWQERIGLEFPLSPVFRMRAGVQTRPVRFSFGFGLDRGIFTFNYANYSHDTLNSQHLISIQMNFGEEGTTKTRASMIDSREKIIEEEINVNTAGERQLMKARLPRVIVRNIIRYRARRGNFSEWSQLYDVPGMRASFVDRLKQLAVLK